MVNAFIKDRLRSYLPPDIVRRADNLADSKSPVMQFFRALSNDLTFIDLYRQGKHDIQPIENWDNKIKLLDDGQKDGFRVLLGHALRSSTHAAMKNKPGWKIGDLEWTLGEFRKMTEENFSENPVEGDLSREEFILLHRLLTSPPQSEK